MKGKLIRLSEKKLLSIDKVTLESGKQLKRIWKDKTINRIMGRIKDE